MNKAYTIREHFKLLDRTAITRESFEQIFHRTQERIQFTLHGWDGPKSRNGETRFGYVYRANVPGFEDCRYIRYGKELLYIDDDRLVENKATGEYSPTARWIVDIRR